MNKPYALTKEENGVWDKTHLILVPYMISLCLFFFFEHVNK